MSERSTPTILVIDDNAQNRALAEAALVDEGFEVILAPSGEEGLRAFAAARPDCIILDVRMPDMDGVTVCRRIRATPGGEHTPIMMLTALRDLETFDSCLQAGADDFMTKPLRPGELVMRVRTALKLGSLNANHSEQTGLIRQQRDELMRLQLLNEQLMAFVVHDLKGPVSTIDLHAQAALWGVPNTPEDTGEHLLAIRREVRTLIRLIMNLLDLGRSTEGRLVLQPANLDLSALVGQVLAEMEVRASVGRVKLEGAVGPLAIRADADLFRRVLENLVDNAIRHAPENSSVRVSASAQEGVAEIRVTDIGPGVPPELRERIFDRFVQAQKNDEPATRSGRGLGLAFCKMVVEAHHGSIRVEDARPGAAFCVRLPTAMS